MSDFLDILTHGRRLKAAVKELSINELEIVQRKLTKVIDDRREEEAELKQQEAEKQKKIQELRKAMDDAGIGVNDLVDGPLPNTKKQRKRAPKPPKYAIIGANGQRITWTGQGRMPNALKEALAQGDKLEKYLI